MKPSIFHSILFPFRAVAKDMQADLQKAGGKPPWLKDKKKDGEADPNAAPQGEPPAKPPQDEQQPAPTPNPGQNPPPVGQQAPNPNAAPPAQPPAVNQPPGSTQQPDPGVQPGQTAPEGPDAVSQAIATASGGTVQSSEIHPNGGPITVISASDPRDAFFKALDAARTQGTIQGLEFGCLQNADGSVTALLSGEAGGKKYHFEFVGSNAQQTGQPGQPLPPNQSQPAPKQIEQQT